MSIVVFWVVVMCNLIGGSQRFGGMYSFHLQVVKTSNLICTFLPPCAQYLTWEPSLTLARNCSVLTKRRCGDVLQVHQAWDCRVLWRWGVEWRGTANQMAGSPKETRCQKVRLPEGGVSGTCYNTPVTKSSCYPTAATYKCLCNSGKCFGVTLHLIFVCCFSFIPHKQKFASPFMAIKQVAFLASVFLLRIRETLDSNLVAETGYPDGGFSWFFSVPQGKFNYAPTASFHILSNSLFILSFDTI
jgi:hypothetical protein